MREGQGASDRNTIKAMLDRAGVVWTERKEDDGGWAIDVREGDGPKNLGYGLFVAVLLFSEDGTLDAVGAWE